MLKDKYVFAQLVKFRHLVDKYDGDKYVKSYTCWNQLTYADVRTTVKS